jgi:hypothetical protein
MFDGAMYAIATFTPERSVSSRLPSLIPYTNSPRHWPSLPVGGPSTAQGHSCWQSQCPT